MTVRARPWRQFVDDHALAVAVAGRDMALAAGNVFVRSLERKVGLGFVTEERGLPGHGIVTSVTIFSPPGDGELPPMRIFMA